MPHLDLDEGFRLYYEVHGPPPGTAPALLLAHGAGGNAMSWWQQVPAFRDRYTVITFDHRAFGRSPDVEEGPGRIAFGTDTRSLLDELGIERVHFVAHSMGGRTAFGLISREPQRLASVVYSGTNGGCVDDRYRALKKQLEGDGTLAGPLLTRAVAEGYADESPGMQFLYRQIRSINPRRHRDFLKPTGRMVNYRGSTAQRLVDSGIPILWLVGDQDRVVHPSLIRISHELTPGSRHVEVPGAGHSAYFERPEAWNAAVRDFIDAVEDGE
ncbi:MAG: alpha/beta fold hydrolase [Dehalococcoidia bacterium]|nr:alpha/beta fold hydrolase [Dehalococcoidia bacterium]